jgi:uncharacterized protein
MKIKTTIVSLVCKNPKLCLLINVIIIILLALNLPSLEQDFSYKGFYEKDHELYKQYDQFVEKFSGDDNIAVVIRHPSLEVFSEDYLDVLEDLTENLWLAPSVIKVTSLTNYIQITSRFGEIEIEEFLYEYKENKDSSYINEKKSEAYSDRVLPGYLIGKDKNATVIILRLRPLAELENDYSETIDFLRDITDQYHGYNFNLIGSPMVTETFRSVSQADLKSIVPISILIISAVIFFLYRRIAPLVITFIVIGFTVIITLSFAAILNIKYNNIVSAVPIILMSICIADCIHFFSSFVKKKSKSTQSLEQAVFNSLDHIFMPTLLTSISTAVGFASLTTSEILPVQGLGALGAIGSLYAWLATLSICAPLVLLFWREKPSKAIKHYIHKSFDTFRLIHHLSNFKIIYLSGVILMTLLMLSLASKNRIDSDPLSYLSDSNPFKVGTLFTINNIGGVQGVEVVVEASEENGMFDPNFIKRVEVFHDWLLSRDSYTSVISYIDIIRRVSESVNDGDEEFYSLPEGLNSREEAAQYFLLYELSLPLGNSISDIVSLDKKTVRITGLWTLYNSSSIINEFDEIEKKLSELGLKAHVSGKMPIYHHMNGFVVKTFFSSIITAILIIAAMMILIFRSFKLGAISLVPNIIPLIWGAGSIWLMGKNVDMGTVVVGALCMGIALDDTIHFLSHYKKNLELDPDVHQALARTLDDIITPLASTTLILILGFLVFLIGDFVPNQNLGLLTAIILFLALFMDIIVLPCLLLLGSNNKPMNMPNR